MSDSNFIDPDVLRYLEMGEGERMAESASKYSSWPFTETVSPVSTNPVEIRIRQQDDLVNRRISCTGSLFCAEIAAPDLLTVDKELGMCAVRDGVKVVINGIRYSTGSLPADQIPHALEAATECDSEAVVLIDMHGTEIDR